VQTSRIVALPSGRLSTPSELYTVPAGMRLVIEYVSFACPALVHDDHAVVRLRIGSTLRGETVWRRQHAVRLERLVRRVAAGPDPCRSEDGRARAGRLRVWSAIDRAHIVQRPARAGDKVERDSASITPASLPGLTRFGF
jgi:hypothetical protein